MAGMSTQKSEKGGSPMPFLEPEEDHQAIVSFIKDHMPPDFWADAWVLREQWHKQHALFSRAYRVFSFISPKSTKHPARAEMEYRLPLTRGYVLARLLQDLGHAEEWVYLLATIGKVRKYEREEDLFSRSAQTLLPDDYPRSGSDIDKMIKIAPYFGIAYAPEQRGFFWHPRP
jgi:hypothetical protein